MGAGADSVRAWSKAGHAAAAIASLAGAGLERTVSGQGGAGALLGWGGSPAAVGARGDAHDGVGEEQGRPTVIR